MRVSSILAGEDNPTITLERPIHFLAPDGSDVLVPPGTYTVEKAEAWLRLIPDERHNAFLLEAESSSHEENIEKPLVIFVPGEEGESPDMQMVMLLLPGGQSLTATGSLSGIRDRGLPGRSARLSPGMKPQLKLPTLQSKDSLQINPNIFNVALFHLVGLWHVDPWSLKPHNVNPSNGKWFWSGAYDLYPRLVHLTWLSQNILGEDINKIVAKEGYGMELRLNGNVLKQGPNALSGDFYAGVIENAGAPFNCPQGTKCLFTTILRTPWKKNQTALDFGIDIMEKGQNFRSRGKNSSTKIEGGRCHPSQPNHGQELF